MTEISTINNSIAVIKDPAKSASKSITGLLIAWSNGAEGALEELMPLVYDDLHKIASRYLSRERKDHTLDPTALVSEAFIILLKQNRIEWEGRNHFFGIVGTIMRRVLQDYGKYHDAAKRKKKGTVRLTSEEFDFLPIAKPEHLILLVDALDDLKKIDPELAKLVELRFFGGLNKDELAMALGTSSATVGRHWRKAKAWLYNYLVYEDEDERIDE